MLGEGHATGLRMREGGFKPRASNSELARPLTAQKRIAALRVRPKSGQMRLQPLQAPGRFAER